MGVAGRYAKLKALQQAVIDLACSEINSKSGINVSYEVIRGKNKKILTISFSFSKK
jgi:plasmid replication initiation protein